MEINATAAVIAIFFSFVIGVVFGGMALLLSRGFIANRQIRLAQKKAARIQAEAKHQAKDIIGDARGEVERAKASTDSEYRERRTELQRQENRLSQKEGNLERKLGEAEQRERQLTSKEKEAEQIREKLVEIKESQLKKLELVADMTSEEAKQSLLDRMEAEM